MCGGIAFSMDDYLPQDPAAPMGYGRMYMRKQKSPAKKKKSPGKKKAKKSGMKKRKSPKRK